MADDQDDAQKTEEPTRKRLEDAVERGQVVTSREMVSFGLLAAFALLMADELPTLGHKTLQSLTIFIEQPDRLPVDKAGMGNVLVYVLSLGATALLVPLVAFIGAIFLANAAQNRLVFSLDPIVPKMEKISLFKGIERLFSARALAEFAKSIIKVIMVAIAAYYAVAPYLNDARQLPDVSMAASLLLLFAMVKRMIMAICIVMFFVAIADYLYQRYEYIKGLRMTKQEVKDEFRQQEGDPKIKQKLRQIRMERARKRMMAAVPTADVIVTNPTHYSVALKYDDKSMRAPRLIAKGIDEVALRIREVAKEHNIPLFESPPLAQALYKTVDVDQEVPAEHYKAVAEVISYVYRLRGKLIPQR